MALGKANARRAQSIRPPAHLCVLASVHTQYDQGQANQRQKKPQPALQLRSPPGAIGNFQQLRPSRAICAQAPCRARPYCNATSTPALRWRPSTRALSIAPEHNALLCPETADSPPPCAAARRRVRPVALPHAAHQTNPSRRWLFLPTANRTFPISCPRHLARLASAPANRECTAQLFPQLWPQFQAQRAAAPARPRLRDCCPLADAPQNRRRCAPRSNHLCATHSLSAVSAPAAAQRRPGRTSLWGIIHRPARCLFNSASTRLDAPQATGPVSRTAPPFSALRSSIRENRPCRCYHHPRTLSTQRGGPVCAVHSRATGPTHAGLALSFGEQLRSLSTPVPALPGWAPEASPAARRGKAIGLGIPGENSLAPPPPPMPPRPLPSSGRPPSPRASHTHPAPERPATRFVPIGTRTCSRSAARAPKPACPRCFRATSSRGYHEPKGGFLRPALQDRPRRSPPSLSEPAARLVHRTRSNGPLCRALLGGPLPSQQHALGCLSCGRQPTACFRVAAAEYTPSAAASRLYRNAVAASQRASRQRFVCGAGQTKPAPPMQPSGGSLLAPRRPGSILHTSLQALTPAPPGPADGEEKRLTVARQIDPFGRPAQQRVIRSRIATPVTCGLGACGAAPLPASVTAHDAPILRPAENECAPARDVWHRADRRKRKQARHWAQPASGAPRAVRAAPTRRPCALLHRGRRRCRRGAAPHALPERIERDSNTAGRQSRPAAYAPVVHRGMRVRLPPLPVDHVRPGAIDRAGEYKRHANGRVSGLPPYRSPWRRLLFPDSRMRTRFAGQTHQARQQHS